MSTKIIDDYRQMIEVENRRVTERLAILSQFEGLLFAALALAWDKNHSLVFLLAIVGILASVSIGKALYNAQVAIDSLYREYTLLPKELKDSAGPVIGKYPLSPKDGIPRSIRTFLTPPLVLPILLGLSWIAIVVIKFGHLP